MPRVILEIFRRQKIKARVRLNNRKLLTSVYGELAIPQEKLGDVLREADKLEKVGAKALRGSLLEIGLSEQTSERVLTLADTRGSFEEIKSKLQELELITTNTEPGLGELESVARGLSDISSEEWLIDLGIVRGLDYYTGTIYETNLVDYPSIGSICSGGRYDDLASGFINKSLPGVGISIGVSRLISYLFKENALSVERQCPTDILIMLPSEEMRGNCNEIAGQLRDKGFNTEIYHQEQNMKKQLRYADRKGIPYMLFPFKYSSESPIVEVKNLASGDQVECPLDEWIRSGGH